MPNACGQPVCSSSTNCTHRAKLYPYALGRPKQPEYKSVVYTTSYTHSIQQLTHSNSAPPTTVNNRLMPTIHTTNKNHKKFYSNNLLLINQELRA